MCGTILIARPGGATNSDEYPVIGTSEPATLDADALYARSHLFAGLRDKPLSNVAPTGALLVSAPTCHPTSRIGLIGVLQSARYAPSFFSHRAGGSSPISRFSR